MRRLWSALSKATKARYRREGITPQRYNAWNRKTRAEQKAIDKAAFFAKSPRARRAGATPVALTTADRVAAATARFNDLYAHPDVRFVSATTVLTNHINASPVDYAQMVRASADEYRERAASRARGNPYWYR